MKKDDLIWLYNNGNSFDTISKLSNIPSTTIHRWIHNKINKRKYPSWVFQEIFLRYKLGFSLKDISYALGEHPTAMTVRKILLDNGINKVLDAQRRQKQLHKETLITLYYDKEFSTRDIAKLMNCSSDHILDELKRYNLKSRKFHTKHTQRTKDKISKATQLEKNAAWLGGKSFEPYGIGFYFIKSKIRKRDNHQCQICGVNDDQLNESLSIHHIDYNKKNHHSFNLISLCRLCHLKTNYDREYWQEVLSWQST